MRPLACLLSLLVVAACAPTVAPIATPPQDQGGAWIALLGNYVGKRVQIRVDGQLVEDRRFTFPPPGATDRVAVPPGPARQVSVRVDIEGCDAPWTGDVPVSPLRQSSLIFDGCDVSTLGPE